MNVAGSAHTRHENLRETWRLFVFAVAGGITVVVAFLAWFTATNRLDTSVYGVALAVMIVAWTAAISLVTMWASARHTRATATDSRQRMDAFETRILAALEVNTQLICEAIDNADEAAARRRWKRVIEQERERQQEAGRELHEHPRASGDTRPHLRPVNPL